MRFPFGINRWHWGILGLAAVAVAALACALLLVAPSRKAQTTMPQRPASNSGALPLTKDQQSGIQTPKMTAPATKASTLHEPVVGFLSRVTKKPFGIYVNPANSPVQPERFSGYHTGADAEYGEVSADVPV